jgi:diguanylate cyclase (GGDEF)-like protein
MRTSEIGRKLNKFALPALVALGGVAVAQRIENRQLQWRNRQYDQWLGLLEKSNARLQEQNEKLERTSDIDHLTQLSLRRTVHQDFQGLQEAYARSQQTRPHRRSDTLDHTHALILLDLDNFHDYNANHGHNAGDKALRQAASSMIENTRDSDLKFRWGGEELGILLPRISIEDAILVAEKIRTAIAIGPENITASFGVAPVDLSQSLEANIGMADQALFDAKNMGRDQVVQFDPARR